MWITDLFQLAVNADACTTGESCPGSAFTALAAAFNGGVIDAGGTANQQHGAGVIHRAVAHCHIVKVERAEGCVGAGARHHIDAAPITRGGYRQAAVSIGVTANGVVFN